MGKKKRKDALSIRVIVLLIAVITFALVFNGCSVSFTTAKITDVETASSVNQETNEPIDKTSVFSPESPMVYVTAKIKNAPDGTIVKAMFYYSDNELEIIKAELEIENTSDNFYFSLSKPDAGFPKGTYRIDLFIDDELNQSVNF